MFRRILHHPMARFLAIGLILFALDGWLNPVRKPDAEAIRVGPDEIKWMAANWRAQFGRAPTQTELDTAVESYLVDEMRYREALALHLDRGDEIVRRRLVQKYEFLFAGDATMPDPDEATLKAYFGAHRDKFRSSWTITFCHVFFDIGSDRKGAFKRASEAMRKLSALRIDDPKAGDLGDYFPHDRCYREADRQSLQRDFGDFFVSKLTQGPIGVWWGPVESGLGFHLVGIAARQDPHPLTFGDAREAVKEAWRDQERARYAKEALLRLREKYRPTVDRQALEAAAAPGAPEGSAASAQSP